MVKAVQVIRKTYEGLQGIGHCGQSSGAKQWHLICAELLCELGDFALDLDYQERFAPVAHSPYNILYVVR